MPNLMKMVNRHESELGLSAEQSQALAEWRANNHQPMRDMAKQVMQMEKALHGASLAGKDRAEPMAMLE
jgi:hypothetical protein